MLLDLRPPQSADSEHSPEILVCGLAVGTLELWRGHQDGLLEWSAFGG
jgi:hypothetical protein